MTTNQLDSMDDANIRAPHRYVKSLMDYNFNRHYVTVLNYWLQIPADRLEMLYQFFIEFFHSVMLIDDIQDRSAMRRGQPVANAAFGLKATINSANYALFSALQKLLAEVPPEKAKEVLAIYTKYTEQLWLGIGVDIYHRDTPMVLSTKQYHSMVSQKSSGWALMYVELMQVFSEDKRDYSQLIDHLWQYVQIRDDYLNLISTEHTEKKGFCSDITEGKFSFLAVHAINSMPSKAGLLMNILSQRTEDVNLKRYFLKQLEEAGTFEYTSKQLEKLANAVRVEVERLGGNPLLEEYIETMEADRNKFSTF